MKPRLVAPQRMSVTPSAYLFVSFELCNKKWHVTASDGGTRICEHTVEAGDGQGLLAVVERARMRLCLGKDVPIVSCYEAGRDGRSVPGCLHVSYLPGARSITAGSSQEAWGWAQVRTDRVLWSTTRASARQT
jgi:hypothetical protein